MSCSCRHHMAPITPDRLPNYLPARMGSARRCWPAEWSCPPHAELPDPDAGVAAFAPARLIQHHSCSADDPGLDSYAGGQPRASRALSACGEPLWPVDAALLTAVWTPGDRDRAETPSQLRHHCAPARRSAQPNAEARESGGVHSL